MTGSGIRIDPPSNQAWLSDTPLKLSPLAMDVLVFLSEHQGKVVTTETLLETLWKKPYATDNALYKVISELRRALKDNPRSPSIIKTVPKRGYSLVGEIINASPESARQHLGRFSTDTSIINQAFLAGQVAMQDRTYELAIKHFKIVLEMQKRQATGNLNIECETLLLIGVCVQIEQGTEAATSWLQKAKALSNRHKLHDSEAKAVLYLSGGLQPILGSTALKIRDELERSLNWVGRSNKPLRNRLKGRIISYTRPVDQKLVRRARKLVDEARTKDDPIVLAHALITWHEVLSSPLYKSERKQVSTELRNLGQQTYERDVIASGFTRGFADALESGDIDAAILAKQQFEELKPSYLFQDDLHRMETTLALMKSDLDSAEEHALSITNRETGPNLVQLLQLFWIRFHQGRLEEVIPFIESTAEENTELPVVTAHLALSYATVGSNEIAARENLHNIVSRLSELRKDITWPSTLVALVETCHRLADIQSAETLLRQIEPYGEAHIVQGAVCYFGAGPHYLGLLHATLGHESTSKDCYAVAKKMHHEVGCNLHDTGS